MIRGAAEGRGRCGSETTDVGRDTGTPVVEDYVNKMPFKFTGVLKRVVVELGQSGVGAADEKELKDAARG